MPDGFTEAVVGGGENQALIDVAQAAVAPTVVKDGDLYAYVVPDGARLEKLDTEHLLPFPRRSSTNVSFSRHDSFAAYVKLHSDKSGDNATTVWLDVDTATFRAVVNDDLGQPGWRDWTATLRLRYSQEWQDWAKAASRDGLGQEAFAEFVEDHTLDIFDPPAADLLELAQSFQANKRVSFASDRRLASGQVQLSYVEEIDATAGRSGTLEVPEKFTIAICPFDGYEPVQMQVRLRYRISEGKLRIMLVLNRPDLVVKEALRVISEQVAERTGIAVWFGDPSVRAA